MKSAPRRRTSQTVRRPAGVRRVQTRRGIVRLQPKGHVNCRRWWLAALLGSALFCGLPAWPLVAQTPAAAPAAQPAGAKKLRVAVFPPLIVPCTSNCGASVSDYRLGILTGEALDSASGIEIAYSTGFTAGKELKDPDLTVRGVWNSDFLPEPRSDLAIRKAKELDVDGVILVRLRTDYAQVRGEVYFVDARIGRTRAYDFLTYRIGRLDLGKDLGAAVRELVKDASKVTGRQTVAVLELEAENADPGAAFAIGEALRNELRKTERYSVLESSEMAATLDRLSAKELICTAVECALTAGKQLGVNKVVAGRVTGLAPGVWKVLVIQVDTATGETTTSESVRHKGSLGAAGHTLAPVAEDLAVTASPDGREFRAEQASWRWKTGLALGGTAVLAFAGAYLSAEVSASNDRQKDDRTRAELSTSVADYGKWKGKLKDEQSAGKSLRGQAVVAQAIAAGLAYYAIRLYFNPPELTPVALNIVPAAPERGGIGLALSYAW